MAMFEVGKSYTITMWENGGTGYSSWTVLEVDGPLIKVVGYDPNVPTVFNTTSQAFVKAELNSR
jgi:hypothetical protein